MCVHSRVYNAVLNILNRTAGGSMKHVGSTARHRKNTIYSGLNAKLGRIFAVRHPGDERGATTLGGTERRPCRADPAISEH